MSVFVKLDESGRVVVPKKFREAFRTNEFKVTMEADERLVFMPVKSAEEMFGSMPDLNIKGFRREHRKER